MQQRNSRIQWMHNRIAAGKYPNESLLAERFGISKRTAERDINYMKNVLGAPLVYCPAHRGFYYERRFSLQTQITAGNDDDYSGIASRISPSTPTGDTVVQLQIPYTAELYIPDKMAAMELKNFVTSQHPRKNLYVCEFHSVELFLGVIMSLDSEIKILSPVWLREKAVSAARKIFECNQEN